MELHEIRYFLALSEALNFTRAAEACNVTQPALTRAIQNLEDKLGGQLVHRERGHTHLTELGRMMRPYFAEMFQRLEEAKRRAQTFVRLEEARLSLGLMCTIGPSRLIDLFGTFNVRYQGVELWLRDGTAAKLEELLIDGEIDVAIFCGPEEPPDTLHTLPLFEERFVIAVAPTHPLAALSEIRLRDLDGQSYLSRINCEYRDHIRAVRERLGVAVRCPYSSERDDWIQSMVMAGLGFTLLPEFAVTVPGLVTRPLVEPAFTRTVALHTVRGRPHSPAVGAFVHECRRYPWARKLKAPPPAPAPLAAE